MQSLDDDANESKDVLMNNFGNESESENETNEEESCLRLHKDFMAIPVSKKNRPPPTKLLQDQKINATALVWNKLLKNSGNTLKDKTPFEIFTSIWTRDVVIYIADETNIFAKQMIKKYQNDGLYDTSKFTQWTPTNPDEIYAFLGVLIAMSQCVKSKYHDYFDPTVKITLTPSYTRYITEERFWLLYYLVHIVDNTWFNQALANPESDVLQLIHFMHHYCLKNNEYIKVWHRNKFVTLLNYCLEKIRDIFASFQKNFYEKSNIHKDIYDKLLENYKTENHGKYEDNLERDIAFCGAKDFRDKVVSHLPQKIPKMKGYCAVCEKVSVHFCSTCDVYLCLRNCYKSFSHSGEGMPQKVPSVTTKSGRVIKKVKKNYDDLTFSLTNKKIKLSRK